jgi:hypothetical protein
MSRGLHTCYLVLVPAGGGKEAQVTSSLMTPVRTEECARGCTRAILFSPGVGGREAHVTILHMSVVRAEKCAGGCAHVFLFHVPVWRGEEKRKRSTCDTLALDCCENRNV